ncbi:hypothetical protein COJ50_07560 [Bacillus cereus]|uniref:Uncharacterized protein n=1 Tax=Bacillus cereus TaxID=1396 RepID=A0A2B1KPE5_BACCE|nr:hypothetical protein CN450_26195 [Bacillus cereus]PFN27951.1 hypothetical protein COJ50_07560 [Bacillus cereus]
MHTFSSYFLNEKPLPLYIIFSLLTSLFSFIYEKFLIIFSLSLHENRAYILYYKTYKRHTRIEIAIPYVNKV